MIHNLISLKKFNISLHKWHSPLQLKKPRLSFIDQRESYCYTNTNSKISFHTRNKKWMPINDRNYYHSENNIKKHNNDHSLNNLKIVRIFLFGEPQHLTKENNNDLLKISQGKSAVSFFSTCKLKDKYLRVNHKKSFSDITNGKVLKKKNSTNYKEMQQLGLSLNNKYIREILGKTFKNNISN